MPRDIEVLARREYSQLVDDWVSEVVTARSVDWRGLLRSLPGVYPRVVLDSLRRQGLDSMVRMASEAAEDASVTQDGIERGYEQPVPDLPAPHPLDFSWWFDGSTIRFLLSRIDQQSSAGDHVILLGSPTLFEPATRLLSSAGKVSLLDFDARMLDALPIDRREATVRRVDLTCDPVSMAPGKLVISDPPWYPSEMRAFLWVARQLCERDGYVVTSVPPMGTRPGVENEWRALQDWSDGLGLELQAYEPGILSYVSPLFEENALAAAGVPVPRGSWRCGDLATFRCVRSSRHDRPLGTRRVDWQEREIDHVRLRVRTNGLTREWRDPTLLPIADSDVFPCVSARDPRRERADVWTSGNRAFSSRSPSLVLRTLEALIGHSDAVTHVECTVQRQLSQEERTLVKQTEARLRTIIQVEAAEIAAWKERYAGVDVVTR